MLNEDYRDILSELLAQEADFILVGAYAMAVHGFVRATMDIDLWVRPDLKNAGRVFKAIEAFGAPVNQICVGDFSAPDLVFQNGIAPRRIDILTSISGVSYEEAELEADSVDIDGYSVKVLSINHLIKNKQATVRTKDLADVELLVGEDS